MSLMDVPWAREKHKLVFPVVVSRYDTVVKRVPVDPQILEGVLSQDLKHAPLEVKKYIRRLRDRLRKREFRYRDSLALVQSQESEEATGRSVSSSGQR